MTTQFEKPLERALQKGCEDLTRLYDYGLVDDASYFEIIEEIGRNLERKAS